MADDRPWADYKHGAEAAPGPFWKEGTLKAKLTSSLTGDYVEIDDGYIPVTDFAIQPSAVTGTTFYTTLYDAVNGVVDVGPGRLQAHGPNYWGQGKILLPLNCFPTSIVNAVNNKCSTRLYYQNNSNLQLYTWMTQKNYRDKNMSPPSWVGEVVPGNCDITQEWIYQSGYIYIKTTVYNPNQIPIEVKEVYSDQYVMVQPGSSNSWNRLYTNYSVGTNPEAFVQGNFSDNIDANELDCFSSLHGMLDFRNDSGDQEHVWYNQFIKEMGVYRASTPTSSGTAGKTSLSVKNTNNSSANMYIGTSPYITLDLKEGVSANGIATFESLNFGTTYYFWSIVPQSSNQMVAMPSYTLTRTTTGPTITVDAKRGTPSAVRSGSGASIQSTTLTTAYSVSGKWSATTGVKIFLTITLSSGYSYTDFDWSNSTITRTTGNCVTIYKGSITTSTSSYLSSTNFWVSSSRMIIIPLANSLPVGGTQYNNIHVKLKGTNGQYYEKDAMITIEGSGGGD